MSHSKCVPKVDDVMQMAKRFVQYLQLNDHEVENQKEEINCKFGFECLDCQIEFAFRCLHCQIELAFMRLDFILFLIF